VEKKGERQNGPGIPQTPGEGETRAGRTEEMNKRKTAESERQKKQDAEKWLIKGGRGGEKRAATSKAAC